MAKFELEPGEQVVHRGSALRVLLPKFFWIAAFIVLFSGLMIADFAAGPGLDLLAVVPLVALVDLGLVSAIVLFVGQWVGLGEVCTITDRRIVAKHGLFRPQIDAMALVDIEDATFEGSILLITGGGRTLELQGYRNGLTAGVLARTLPRWFPDAGKPMARLGRILQPGETVIFRYPGPWFDRVLWGLFLGVAGVFLWSGYRSYLRDDWSGVLSGGFWIFLMMSALPGVKGGWHSVVTDRRLLRRFDWDGTRYQDIPLGEIEAGWRSRFAEKLAARWRGQTLDIPAEKDAAERVLGAIEAAKGAV